MAWCAAARSFHMPAIDVGALRSRAPLAVGVGCVSFAGANLRRSARSPAFASLGISTDATAGEFLPPLRRRYPHAFSRHKLISTLFFMIRCLVSQEISNFFFPAACIIELYLMHDWLYLCLGFPKAYKPIC